LIDYRFHHFETLLNSGVATAVTFWYKVSSATKRFGTSLSFAVDNDFFYPEITFDYMIHAHRMASGI